MAYLGKTIEKKFHYGAKPEIFKLANELRKNMTDAEDKLWQRLRNRKLNNLKFRRQHPINKFIADFFCAEKELIIEVDGGIHNDPDAKEHDENRTYELEQFGLKIIRFTNEEVMNNIDKVLNEIIIITSPPTPLPRERGVREQKKPLPQPLSQERGELDRKRK